MPTTAPPNSKRYILIVDDDLLLLEFLGEVLRHAGYETAQASSAEQALELIGQREPDLALLDIHMPGMSGLDLAKQLHSQTSVPFMFLSGRVVWRGGLRRQAGRREAPDAGLRGGPGARRRDPSAAPHGAEPERRAGGRPRDQPGRRSVDGQVPDRPQHRLRGAARPCPLQPPQGQRNRRPVADGGRNLKFAARRLQRPPEKIKRRAWITQRTVAGQRRAACGVTRPNCFIAVLYVY